MDEAALIARLDALCAAAEALRLPGHRHTAEAAMIAHDELRAGLRRLRREISARPARPRAPSRSTGEGMTVPAEGRTARDRHAVPAGGCDRARAPA